MTFFIKVFENLPRVKFVKHKKIIEKKNSHQIPTILFNIKRFLILHQDSTCSKTQLSKKRDLSKEKS